MIAEERVVGVLVVASTDEKRAFSAEELAVLQTLAAEAALALERLRSAVALADALGREQTVAAITRRIRAELHPDGVLAVARDELHRALQLDRTTIELGDEPADGTPIVAHGERIGSLLIERARPLDAGELFSSTRWRTRSVRRSHGVAARREPAPARAADRAAPRGAGRRRASSSSTPCSNAARRGGDEAARRRRGRLLPARPRAQRASLRRRARPRPVARRLRVHARRRASPDAAICAGRPVSVDDYQAIAAPVPHPPTTGSRARSSRRWCGPARRAASSASASGRVARASTAPTTSCSRRSRRLRRSRFATPRPSPSARVRRACSAASIASPRCSASRSRWRRPTTPRRWPQPRRSAATSRPCSCKAGAGLRFAGGHELPDELRALELPPALVEAAPDGHVLAATAVRDDERFDASWRNGAVCVAARDPGARRAGRGSCSSSSASRAQFARDDLELAQQVAAAARGALERSRLFEARAHGALAVAAARPHRPPARDRARPGAGARGGRRGGDGAARRRRSGARRARGRRARRDRRRRRRVPTRCSALARRRPAGSRATSCSRAPPSPSRTSAGDESLLGVGRSARGRASRLSSACRLTGPRRRRARRALRLRAPKARAWREEEIQALGALAANASVALCERRAVPARRGRARTERRDPREHRRRDRRRRSRRARRRCGTAAAEEITGVPAAEAIGRTPAQVLQRELESETGGTNRLVAIPRRARGLALALRGGDARPARRSRRTHLRVPRHLRRSTRSSR